MVSTMNRNILLSGKQKRATQTVRTWVYAEQSQGQLAIFFETFSLKLSFSFPSQRKSFWFSIKLLDLFFLYLQILQTLF